MENHEKIMEFDSGKAFGTLYYTFVITQIYNNFNIGTKTLGLLQYRVMINRIFGIYFWNVHHLHEVMAGGKGGQQFFCF